MSARAQDLLIHGIAAAKDEDIEQAEFYLESVLNTDSTEAQKVSAWEWLAQVTDDPRKKRDYLEEIIIRQPGNVAARRGLAILNGELDPGVIIDPTHRQNAPRASDPVPEMQELRHGPDQPAAEGTKAKRFICQQCGGSMAFTADGQALTCDYCDLELSLFQAMQAGAMVEEKDFAVALATAKGHTHAVTMQAFTCQGCGAPFVLGPAVLSLTCPYCSSAHVIEERETCQLIPPTGVIPFALTDSQIRDPFVGWLKQKNLYGKVQVARPGGLYLPVWTFDIAGAVIARVRGYSSGRGVRMPAQTIEHPVFYNDIPVIASHRLPARLTKEVDNFQLDELVPYDPGYLADWPAAAYQISAAQASLVARKQAWQHARDIIGSQIRDQVASPLGGSNVEMTLSSANMYVDAFKLILLPLWLIHYRHEEETYEVVVNGQNGHIRGQTPASGLKRWLGKLLS